VEGRSHLFKRLIVVLVSVSGLVSAFPMFGSSFFYIQSSSNAAINTPCVLAVNQNGLNFLSKETHVSLTPCFPIFTKSLCKDNLLKLYF